MSEQQKHHSQSNNDRSEKTLHAAALRNEDVEIDLFAILGDIWRGGKRYWLQILVTLSLLSGILFWIGRNYITPVYEANCTFLVNTSGSVNYSSGYYTAKATSQIARTFPYIIQNDALQGIIEEDLGVSPVPATITATSVEETNMLTIHVQAEEPKIAYDVLQSILRNYAEVADAVLGETDLTIMNESGVPTHTVNPIGPRKYALAGFLIAAVIWIGILILNSLLKQTIRQQDDFAKILNIKCLGATPKVRIKKRSTVKNSVLITDRNVSYGFTEGIRTLRTRIERDSADTGSKIYLFSSALAGEGKSTISVNLALSLAEKGMNVVLMDMDLRNASVLKILGIKEAKKGIAEFLSGTASFEDVVIKEEKTGLMVIPAGRSNVDLTQTINSRKLANVFDILRVAADYVIVDTPPSSILSDAAAIARYADGGVFVVRQDFAPVERIKEGIELLTDSGLKLTGCMLNYTQMGLSGYSYGYSNYGHYGRYGRYGRYGSSSNKR